MLRLTLAQMRRSLGRLIAAGLAIALGTGFIAATFMGTAVFTDTARANFAAGYGEADLVINERTVFYQEPLSVADFEAIRALPEVAGVHDRDRSWTQVESESTNYGLMLWKAPTDERLLPHQSINGRLPEKPGEITVPESVATYLDIGLGDSLTVYPFGYISGEADSNGPEERSLTVVGIITERIDFSFMNGEVATIHEDESGFYSEMSSHHVDESAIGGEREYIYAASIKLSDGVSVQRGLAAINDATTGPSSWQTPQQAADEFVSEMLPAQIALTTIVLIFAVIALAVAAMVIGNTFQVLVAQRAHTLAMLRCVGASSRQVQKSVRQEAALLGAASALVGVVGAWMVLQLVLAFARRWQDDLLLPSMVSLNWLTVLVPITAGTLMAFVASRGAGVAATQVPALAALRPLDPPDLRDKRGVFRLGISILLLVSGGIGVLTALIAANDANVTTNTAFVGVLGCITAFSAVLISIPLWLPKALVVLGRPVRRTGPMSRLAIANTQRNPRRTAATSAALLIGVTLVTTVATAAEVTKATVNDTLDDTYPYDLQVSHEPHMYPRIAALLEGNEHVVAYSRVLATDRLIATTLDGTDISYPDDFGYQEIYSNVVDLDEIGDVVRSGAVVPPEPGTMVLPREVFTTFGPTTPWGTRTVLDPGDEILLHVWPEPDWDSIDWDYYAGEEQPNLDELTSITVKAVPGSNNENWNYVFMHDTVLSSPDSDVLLVNREGSSNYWRSDSVWVKIDDISNARALLADLNPSLSELGAYAWGPAEDRASIETVIDIAVKVVYALLAIAVLIAIVGVTNTLSLSVIERRRESATMRTIGLKQRQLRRSLAIEGVFISVAGATLGLAVGVLFGWLGVRMLAGPVTTLSLPWMTLGIILVGAVIAGLLASWVPARMAAKTTPVEALANE